MEWSCNHKTDYVGAAVGDCSDAIHAQRMFVFFSDGFNVAQAANICLANFGSGREGGSYIEMSVGHMLTSREKENYVPHFANLNSKNRFGK